MVDDIPCSAHHMHATVKLSNQSNIWPTDGPSALSDDGQEDWHPEEDEACVFAPGSTTGSQGRDLMARKMARSRASEDGSPITPASGASPLRAQSVDSSLFHSRAQDQATRLHALEEEMHDAATDQRLEDIETDLAVQRACSQTPNLPPPSREMLGRYEDPVGPSKFEFRENQFKRRFGPLQAAHDAPLLHEKNIMGRGEEIPAARLRTMLIQNGADPNCSHRMRLYAHALQDLGQAGQRTFLRVRGAINVPEKQRGLLPPLGPFCTAPRKATPSTPGLFQCGGPVRSLHQTGHLCNPFASILDKGQKQLQQNEATNLAKKRLRRSRTSTPASGPVRPLSYDTRR